MAKKIQKIQKKHAPILILFVAITISFFVVLLLVGLKYQGVKQQVTSYKNLTAVQKSSQEDTASVIATTIGILPGEQPLYLDPPRLQAYVETLQGEVGMDIIVVDTDAIILADTAGNAVGESCDSDIEGQVKQTILDGNIRRVADKHVSSMIVPIRDYQDVIVGAVILSSESSL